MPRSVADVVERDDVGVIEGGGRPGFLLESRDAVRVRRHDRRQDLDRDFAMQARVVRPIDLAHAAFAQFIEDAVWTEFFANHRVLDAEAQQSVEPELRA